jgi:hypothetical protein
LVAPKTPHCENVIMTFVRFGAIALHRCAREVRSMSALPPIADK